MSVGTLEYPRLAPEHRPPRLHEFDEIDHEEDEDAEDLDLDDPELEDDDGYGEDDDA